MSMSRKGKLLFVSQKNWRATQDLNPKMAGGEGQFDPLPCGFSKSVFSRERVKP